MYPVVVPSRACTDVVVPPMSTVYLLPSQAVPSLSTITTPFTVGVPISTWAPPDAASDVQPIGSSSQSAGIRRTKPGIATAVADRVVV